MVPPAPCAEITRHVEISTLVSLLAVPGQRGKSTLRAHQMAPPGQRRSARDSKIVRGQGGSLCSRIADGVIEYVGIRKSLEMTSSRAGSQP